ncbi:MAG TPA: hypothetical protein PKC65_15935 [Pyrinomonadaceae bacterium]|nr:hypothetical protein [Pyrinomonadaceae bacterium]
MPKSINWLTRREAVGALAGGGFEIAKQKLWDGNDNIDWKKVGGASAQGAIFGAVAGATGGMSLPVQIASLALANAVGGIANRSISTESSDAIFSPTAIAIDTVAGGAGAYLAPLGRAKYMTATEASRNAAAEQVDILLASDPIPGQLPTLTRPVVTDAIKNEIRHGKFQAYAYSGSRSAGKAGTSFFLDWIFNKERADASNRDKSKDRNLEVGTSCSVTTDSRGVRYSMCSRVIE